MSGGKTEVVAAAQLRAGDIVLVETGDLIPADGEVIEGVASVNEAAITGESAPVIREGGGDRSAVTAGTRVISDWIKVRVTQEPGQGFLDRMIALVEGAERQKTPNEIALTILLVGLTIIFLIAVATIPGFATYAGGDDPGAAARGAADHAHPDDDRGACCRRSALPAWTGWCASTCSPNRAARSRPRAISTCCCSTRPARSPSATATRPSSGRCPASASTSSPKRPTRQPRRRDARRAARSSRSRARNTTSPPPACRPAPRSSPFPRRPGISGLKIGDTLIQKGAVDSDSASDRAGDRRRRTGRAPVDHRRDRARRGHAARGRRNGRLLGVLQLKDILKAGMRERFAELRRMGIRTVMITGDNPLTAASIAAEAGVDDFLAEATPEDKLALIRSEQTGRPLVAMCGDGTNDAPALAQADVGVAMNTGTQAAREAGNMVDLDSDPTKLIEVVGLGKQLLMTRGALTTFSVANDVAKYFAIIPAIFVILYPALGVLNIMGLHSSQSAILSAIIFNALIIPALVPLALKGVKYRPAPAGEILRRNLAIYGVGGIVAPFIGIKLIDLAVSGLGLA